MKVIYPDKVNTVVADEENASYPDDNVLDDYPKRVWQATSAHARLTLSVASGAGAVAVFNTNAASITVTVSDGISLTLQTGLTLQSGLTLMTGETLLNQQYDLDPSGVGALWADYAQVDNVHRIDLDFVGATGATIYAGVARAGTMTELRDPRPGVREGLRDYSIVKELNNGAYYTRKRDVVRTFGFALILARATDFYTFMRTILQQNGPGPLAYWIVDDGGDWDWLVFARPEGFPVGSHDLPAYSNVEVTLVEVI